MEKLIVISFLICYSAIICIPVFLRLKKWICITNLLIGMIVLMPILYSGVKNYEILDKFNENSRIVTVVYDSIQNHTLDILVAYNISKFDSGETAVLSRSFWSDDFRLKDLNFEIFRDKSVLRGLNDIQMIHDNGWYNEGLVHGEEASRYACLYTAYKKVIVIHDSKE